MVIVTVPSGLTKRHTTPPPEKIVDDELRDQVLNNPLILTKILGYSSQNDAKTQRLVCSTWNSVILSLPTPKLNLVVNQSNTGGCCDSQIFEKFSATMDPDLARWISVTTSREKTCTCNPTPAPDEESQITHFQFRNSVGLSNFRFCGENYDEIVKFVSLKISTQSTPQFHSVLRDHFPNIGGVSVIGLCDENELEVEQISDFLVMSPIPKRSKLETLMFRSREYTDSSNLLNSMLQLLVTSAPNLKKLYLQMHNFPDLSRNRKLESFSYCTIIQPSQIYGYSLSGLSNLLKQVAINLRHLKLNLYHGRKGLTWVPNGDMGFNMPKFGNLVTFKTNFVHIFPCGDYMEKVVGDKLETLQFCKGLGKAGDVQTLLENMAEFKPYLNNPVKSMRCLFVDGVRDERVLDKIQVIFPSLKIVRLSYKHFGV